jgi:hypothetical protein
VDILVAAAVAQVFQIVEPQFTVAEAKLLTELQTQVVAVAAVMVLAQTAQEVAQVLL